MFYKIVGSDLFGDKMFDSYEEAVDEGINYLKETKKIPDDVKYATKEGLLAAFKMSIHKVRRKEYVEFGDSILSLLRIYEGSENKKIKFYPNFISYGVSELCIVDAYVNGEFVAGVFNYDILMHEGSPIFKFGDPVITMYREYQNKEEQTTYLGIQSKEIGILDKLIDSIILKDFELWIDDKDLAYYVAKTLLMEKFLN